jgi:starch-binding outer membrane protein, SusD/RagB family
MKTSYFKAILLVAFTFGVMSACKDYLNVDPVSSFGPDYVFSDVPNATKAVIGVYSPLGGDFGYGIRVNMYYPYDSDDIMGQSGPPNDGERRELAHYSVTPSNTQLPQPFNQMYAGIERANICIYYIPKMSAYANGSNEEQGALKRLHGEALMLRAQYYYELIRNWGDVPAQFLPSSFETDLFKAREDRDVIYDQLLSDLQEASALVPWKSGVPLDERITQGAVRALRARIALARGGYSLRSDNTMKRAANYKDYYQIARDECQAIIQSGEHRLNPSYQSVFKDAITAHQLEPNGEVIWEVGMTGSNSTNGDSKLGYYNGPRVAGNGNGALTILPTYFYAFDANDTRRDVTCAPYDVNLDGTVTARSLETMVDGKFRRDWMTNPAPSPTSTQQYFGLNWPLIRYSDVLLMFAEAENELNGAPTGAGVAAFEQVRNRAFAGNNIGTTPADYTGFFTAIVNERLLEFGGEGMRKYDLIRWNMLSQKLSETKAKLAAMVARQPPYNNLPATMYYRSNSTSIIWLNPLNAPTPVSAPSGSTSITWVGTGINTIIRDYAIQFTPNKNELLPIAASVLATNPNLTQNGGY